MRWVEPRRFDRQPGFTLLELLTVIAIIGVLAAVLIGVSRRATQSGKIARAKAELAVLASSLEAYQRAYGDYPQTDNEADLLQALIGKLGPLGATLTGRPVLETAKFAVAVPSAPTTPADPSTNSSSVLLDPWSQPYVYVYKVPAAGWSGPAFVLYSIGPDGRDAPALLAGGLPDATAPDNTDNLYANRF